MPLSTDNSVTLDKSKLNIRPGFSTEDRLPAGQRDCGAPGGA